MRNLSLLLALSLGLPSASLLFAEVKSPESYVQVKGAIPLSADKKESGSHRAIGFGARFLPNDPNLLLSLTTSGEMILWNLTEKKPVWRKPIFKTGQYHFEISLDGKFAFVTGPGGLLKIVRNSDGAIVHEEKIAQREHYFPMALALNASQLVFSQGAKNKMLSWRSYTTSDQGVEFGERGTASQKDAAYSYDNAVSPDGKLAAISYTYTDGNKNVTRDTLDLYETETEKLVTSIPRSGEFRRLAFDPEGKSLAFWGNHSDPNIYLVNLQKPENIRVIFSDMDRVAALRFSADGKKLFCIGDLTPIEEGKPAPYVRVAEVATGKFLSVLVPSLLEPNPDSAVVTSSLDISRDGKTAALSFSDYAETEDSPSGLPDFVLFKLE